MNSFRRILSFILGILLMFLASQLYFSLKQDVLTQEVVQQETLSVTDTICEHGEISEFTISQYLKSLSITNSLYDIDIVHKKLALEPEYRFKTAEEIIADQNHNYTGENVYHDSEVITEQPEVINREPDGLSVTTDTNESVMATAHDTGPSEGHVHSSACNIGHLHSGEPYFYINHAHDYSTCHQYVSSITMTYYCMACCQDGQKLLVSNYWNDGHVVNAYHSPPFDGTCANCGSTMLIHQNQITEYSYSCGYNKDIDGDSYFDAVSFGQTYTYKTTEPESEKLHTYDNGCYHYHKSQTREYSSDYYDSSEKKSNNYWLLYDLSNGNVRKYCGIPLYYTLVFDWVYNGWNCTHQATYKAVVESDDTVHFEYVDYYPSSDEAHYPQILTADQMRSYQYSTRGFFNTYTTGTNYDSGNQYIKMWGGYINLCSEIYHDGWSLSCGLEENSHCVCNEIITSISPTHPTQTIYNGNALITTLVVHYLDGSTKTVIGSASFDVNHIGNGQTATISYSGLNTSKETQTFTASIQVNVIPKKKTCSNGHNYWLNDDGSDTGCPYCKAWLSSLSIVSPVSGSLEIVQGTTLEENGVKLLATYMDGREEYLTTGYVHNLDHIYIGEKPVTIGYKGKTVSLMVTVKRKVRRCTICGRYYELYPDGTDPGCPYCQALIPVFTGNVMHYYTEYTTEEIMDVINAKGSYPLSQGDEITISVHNTSQTLASKLLSLFGLHGTEKIKAWVTSEVRADE